MIESALALLAIVHLPPLPRAVEVAPPPVMLMSFETPRDLVRSDAVANDFYETEEALKAELETATSPDAANRARRTLAELYHAHGLSVETLAALNAIDPPPTDEAARFMTANAEYSLGRYRRALATISGDRREAEGRLLALEGLALTRLGAFARAGAALSSAGVPPSRALRAEFHLARAAAAIAAGDTHAARAALDAAGPLEPGSALRREAQFLEAKVYAQRGEREAARRLFEDLARGEDAAAARAHLALLDAGVAAGETPRLAALEKARAIMLHWRGGEVEREALFQIGSLAGEAPEAFAAFRQLAERHADADLAHEARARLGALVAGLAEAPDVAAAEKTDLFYEMIDFAPQGTEGDALIRSVAARLEALDLLGPAAELLEHQVFNRLRGPERSLVGADLAALYLADRKPAEALRVLASTRIAGLDEDADARRRLLEARALLQTDDIESALALLEDAPGAAANKLKGDAHWAREDWRAAADAYRAFFAGAANISRTEEDAVLRASLSMLLAKDEAGFRTFRKAAAPALGANAATLLNSLSGGEQTAEILGAYRRYYARSDAAS